MYMYMFACMLVYTCTVLLLCMYRVYEDSYILYVHVLFQIVYTAYMHVHEPDVLKNV